MNKTYKSIFNKSTGTYVAVSETAKSKTKGAAILSVCLAAIMTTTNVFAAQTIDANQNVIFGTSAYQGGSAGSSNVAIGTSTGQKAMGDYNNSLGAASGQGVVGNSNNNIGQGSARNLVGNNNNNLGTLAGVNSIGNDNTYIGHSSGVRVEGSENIAIGLGALNDGSGGSFTGSGNVVLGTKAAVTNSAKGVATDSTVVLGELAKAQVSNSVAIGSMSVASRTSGIAGYIPVGATISQQTAINATQSTLAAVSVGDEGKGLYRQITAIAAGTADTDAVNVAQLKAIETHYYSVNDNGVIGGNYNNDGAIGVNAIAAGVGATATKSGGVAMGSSATVSATNGVALGNKTNVAGGSGIAIGDGTQALAAGGIAIGAGAYVPQNTPFVSATDNIAIGTNASATADKNVAVGAFASVSGDSSVAFGHSAIATGDTAVAVGTLAKASSTSDTAIGYKAQASGGGSIALGISAISSGLVSTAVGNGSVASGDFSSAFGAGANATGNDSLATGTSSIASARNASVYGTRAESTKDGATAVGTRSKATEVNAVAIGAYTQASLVNSVALGTHSITDSNSVYSKTSTNNGIIFGNYAGTVNTNTGYVVSVGAIGVERQIKNVASGVVSSTSTDAINGSQLYATDVALGNVANSTKNILGGNAKLNSDGSITMTNIGDTGKNNIHDAIKAVTASSSGSQEEVVAGTNIASVVKTTDATTGKNTFTVNANGTTASAGSTAVTVTSKAGANNVTDYVVDLSQTTKDDIKAGVDAKDAVDNAGLTFNGDSGTTGIKKLGDAVAVTGDANITTEATAAGVAIKLNPQIDLGALGSVTMGNTVVNTNGLTIAGGASVTSVGVNAGGSKITNVAAGTANTDAVNVSQLKEVSDVANAGWNIATDSGAAAASNVKPSDTVNFNGDGNVVVSNVGNDVTVGLADKVTIGKGGTAVTIDGTNGTIQAGGVTINGDKGTVNGLSNTTWDANNIVKGQAATEDQLKVVADNVTAAVRAAKTKVKANKNVFLSSKPGDKGQTVYTVATKDEVDFNKVTVGGLTIDKTNVDAAGNTIISGVGAGELSSTSTDVVNGGQLYATNQQVAKNTTDITNINTNLDKGLNFSADSGTAVNRKLGDTVAITGDGNITTTTTANGVQLKLSDNIDVKNVKVSESITVAEGAKVDMGGNVIQNVAPGVNGTDAVNVNQVNAVAGNLNNRINRVGHIANAGVAQAIATAGLPQAYLPGKSMMAVAGGTYEGEAGYAIGFSTISDNGKWIIKVTGSGNSRDKYGASLGAGYQW